MSADAAETEFTVGRAEFARRKRRDRFRNDGYRAWERVSSRFQGTCREVVQVSHGKRSRLITRESGRHKATRLPALRKPGPGPRARLRPVHRPDEQQRRRPSASTVTRTNGSVPDGRRTTRPSPASWPCTRASTRWTSASATSRGPPLARILTVVCGTFRMPLAASARLRTAARQRLEDLQRTDNRVAGRDPVQTKDVTGRFTTEHARLFAQRLHHVAITDLGAQERDAKRRPSPARVRNCSSRCLPAGRAGAPARASRWPARKAARRHRRHDRWHPPSADDRRRHRMRYQDRRRLSTTALASAEGLVEPQSRLMLRPSGRLPIAVTVAPSSLNIFGAI